MGVTQMNELSMSISAGDLAGDEHNLDLDHRATLKNVDPLRSRYNVCLCDTPLPKLYDREFGAAVSQYNAKQVEKGHPERQIKDYLDKISKSRQEKEAYELVIQLGSFETMPATDPECRSVSQEILTKFYDEWHRKYPNLAISTAVIHMDEATPHLHIVYVPVSHHNKRGVETKNSLRGALKEMGFGTDLRDLNEDMFHTLEGVSQQCGIWRLDMGMAGVKRLSVRDFKAHVNDPDYPYENDPELMALLDQQTSELEEAQRSIDEMVEDLEDIAQTPTGVTHMGEMRDAIARAGGVAQKGRVASAALERAIEAVEDFFDAVPEFWRKYVLNPVSAALGSIFARLRAAERQETLDQIMERCDTSLADAVSRARAAALRTARPDCPQVKRDGQSR